MTKTILTREYLIDRLSFDPVTGVFTHNYNFGSRYRIGDRADTPGYDRLKGYRLINLLNQKFLAHRCAWMYVNGSMPELHIDHINGDRGDNSIENLREVSHKTNIQNQRKPTKRNTSGLLGVTVVNGRYIAKLTVNYRTVYVGSYETPEQAHEAYVLAKRRLHDGCTL